MRTLLLPLTPQRYSLQHEHHPPHPPKPNQSFHPINPGRNAKFKLPNKCRILGYSTNSLTDVPLLLQRRHCQELTRHKKYIRTHTPRARRYPIPRPSRRVDWLTEFYTGYLPQPPPYTLWIDISHLATDF